MTENYEEMSSSDLIIPDLFVESDENLIVADSDSNYSGDTDPTLRAEGAFLR